MGVRDHADIVSKLSKIDVGDVTYAKLDMLTDDPIRASSDYKAIHCVLFGHIAHYQIHVTSVDLVVRSCSVPWDNVRKVMEYMCYRGMLAPIDTDNVNDRDSVYAINPAYYRLRLCT